MNIGQVAAASGVTAKMIRHYEQLGLVTPSRMVNGYRSYTEEHVNRMKLAHDLRALNTPLKQVKAILAAMFDGDTSPEAQKALADLRKDVEARRDIIRRMTAVLMQPRKPMVAEAA